MYISINHWTFKVPVATFKDGIEKELLPQLKSMPGFHHVYFVQEGEGKGAFVVVWESETALKNAEPLLGQGWFGKVAFANAAGAPVRGGGDVMVHG